MATMRRPRLAAVEALADYKLRLTFINGDIYSVSFTEDIVRFPGLAPLQDPEAFSKAQIIPGEGWAVEWPDLDIQIGADTLWLDAQAQNAPDENTRFFAEWRSRNHLSLSAAAAALGLTPRTMSAYGSGKRAVPVYIALACKGWEAEHGKHERV